ncbi:MAG: YlbF family regulator [Planctomycetota bacterium]
MKTQEIVELADRLGRALADSAQAKALSEAQQQLQQDPETSRLVSEYRDQAEKISRLEQEGKPVEPEDKNKLDELHSKLASMQAFKKYTAAQYEYADLMRRVDDALSKHLGAESAKQGEGTQES